MKNYLLKVVTILILLMPCKSIAQIDRSDYYSFGDNLFFEVHSLPSNSLDSLNAKLLIKIANNYITYMKMPKATKSKKFFGVPKLEFIFKGTDGVIKKRMAWKDTVYVDSYNKTLDKKSFKYGVLNLVLKNDEYKIKVDYYNKKSKKNAKISINLDKVDYLKQKKVGSPIFNFKSDIENLESIRPMAISGNMSFSSKGARVIVPISYKKTDKNYFFSLNKIKTDKKNKLDALWKKRSNMSGKCTLHENSVISFEAVNSGNELIAKIMDRDIEVKNDFPAGLLDFIIPEEKIVPGDYELKIYSERSFDTTTSELSVIWADKPLSMNNIEYAIGTMFYILSDEEYDTMESGNKEEQLNSFIKYWESHDPSPLTPFNEAMYQYFTRVDYARFNFNTISQRDGAKTDRGKIYILHGTPSENIQSLNDDRSVETWEYPNLKKRFVFEMVSTGVFKLVKIIDT